MPVGKKLRYVRGLQPDQPSQQAVANLLGIPRTRYQSYEQGRARSKKKLSPVTSRLAEEWNVPEEWFWDAQDTNPYLGANAKRTLKELRVRVYHASPDGKLSRDEELSEMVPINSDLAALDPIALELPDDQMSPRFEPGWRIYGVYGRRLKPGSGYIAERKQPLPGKKERELIVGVYVVLDGEFYLEPLRNPERRVKTLDLQECALIVARQEVLDNNPNWVLTEMDLQDGLPMKIPKRT